MSEREFSESLGYQFHDLGLLKNALTHSSLVNESRLDYKANNERLEFLGDAFFDAAISEYLYNRLPDVEEGELTKTRAIIVCERSLAECGQRFGIGEHLRLGKGEEHTGGRNRHSIVADAMEAVIGAIFLDGGWEEARAFILRAFAGTIQDAIDGKLYSDYKTELQEFLQARGENHIHYEVEKETGPDHDKTFYVALFSGSSRIGEGSGRSKKEAEQNAAKAALDQLKK